VVSKLVVLQQKRLPVSGVKALPAVGERRELVA